ncbi:MAG: putative DNA binding domain-containing protein [Melioribacteraceae bacterium]|nr:putative DNA binding domain-containing protein [Melioribacteraceae bacterium]
MTRKKIIQMIEHGENITIEFKQRFSSHEKIAKEMIAFANTRGGYILFGVEDDGSIYGLESERSDIELIKETAERYCEPAVQYKLESIEIEKKDLIAVQVFESEFKPNRMQDYKKEMDLNSAQVYVRINDKSVLASKEMIKILQTQSRDSKLVNYTVGSLEKIVFEYLDKNETITVKQLGKIANVSDRRASRTLIKLVRADLLIIHQKENGESYFSYSGN